MRNFSKVALSLLLFLALLFGASVAVIEPFCNSASLNYMDKEYRQSIAGSIDTLFLGASQVQCGIEPKTFDGLCNMNSYNISAGVLSYKARRILFEDEVERNPIKNVFLEISTDSLIHPSHTEGDIDALTKMKDLPTRLSYLCDRFNVDAFYKTYTTLIYNSKTYIKQKITDTVEVQDFSNKGVFLWPDDYSADVTLYGDNIEKEHNTKILDTDFNSDSIKEIEKISNICRDKGINLTLFVTPISEALIWKTENLDEWYSRVTELAKSLDCKLVDFNLDKRRFELYSDSVHFHDVNHLCDCGAKAFNLEFAEYINGNLTDLDFYTAYAEMKELLQYHTVKP